MTGLPSPKRPNITVVSSAPLDIRKPPNRERGRRGGCVVATVVVGVLSVIATACGGSELGRVAYPLGAPAPMAELDCARFDGENSTTLDRPSMDLLAADPEAALDEFATTGFIELDDPAGVLDVVDRDSSRARAEYRVGDATRAVLLLATNKGWWVNTVTWCSELDKTASS